MLFLSFKDLSIYLSLLDYYFVHLVLFVCKNCVNKADSNQVELGSAAKANANQLLTDGWV